MKRALRTPSLLLVAVLASTLVSCGPGGGSGAEPRARNVILISIDTLRPDFLGCYGYGRETSPTIDRLADEGTLFVDCTSGAPWTLPGHASMLSGLYPATHGAVDHLHGLAAPTLATILAAEGFDSAAIVNSMNVGAAPLGLLRGFGSTHVEPEFEPPRGGPGALIANRGPQITRRALQWLDNRSKAPGADRFLLFLHYYDVHSDFSPDTKHRQMFARSYQGPIDGRTSQLVALRQGALSVGPEDVQHLRDLYAAEIRQLDDVLAELLDYLDQSGLSENTLVVLTSDHGEEFLEHGGVLHGRTQYQELLAVPWILRGPGVPAGRREAAAVHQVDILPTVLQLLGIELDEAVDGLDASTLWRRPSQWSERRYLYASADHNNVVDGQQVTDIKKMVRLGNDKLLVDTTSGLRELYNLAVDPGEQVNLADKNPSLSDLLFAELQRVLAHQGRGVPIPPPSRTELQKLKDLGY